MASYGVAKLCEKVAPAEHNAFRGKRKF